MHEIQAVELVTGTKHISQSSVINLAALETAVDFSRSFQIRTIPNGSNSGRKYFLQTENDTESLNLVSSLQDFVLSAVHKNKSPGRRRQDFVRSIYNSGIFQSFAALLIILVILPMFWLSFACGTRRNNIPLCRTSLLR
jgi:hypothetical protein